MKRRLLISASVLLGLLTAIFAQAPQGPPPRRGSGNGERAKDTSNRPLQNLWIPPAAGGKTLELTLAKSKKSFWNGATTDTFCFNNTGFWGPTLFLNQGETVQIKVKNDLDEVTTLHWHGIHLPAAMDGGPHQMIQPGATWTSSFIVKNNAATYWYHPHPHENTQKQLTMGAGGLIIIRDPVESKLALPRAYGVDDIPLVLTSRRFHTNDQFSSEGDSDKYGDYLFTNGTLDAQVSLPAQFVRLRILNAEIERGYDMGFSDDRTFYLIATDGGLVDTPVPLKRLKLMVGERAELLVDLSKDKIGSSIDLMSYNANQPFGFPGGEPGRGPPNGGYLNAMDFRLLHINIAAPTAQRITKLPDTLVKNHYPSESEVTAKWETSIIRFGSGEKEFAFDRKYFDMNFINHVVKLGAVEAWTIRNDRTFGHSFHVHDVQFKITSRSDGPVPAHEQGWKDTLYLPRDASATFVARFDDYASDDAPFMYHCHMANHEDGGLMGQFLVSKNPSALKRDSSGQIQFRAASVHPLTPEMLRKTEEQSQKPAPAFSTTDLNGNPLNFAALTAKKPLVLYFIERECPCARDAVPFMQQLHDVYADACEVIGVINADSTTALAWTKRSGAKFPIIADPECTIIRAYGAECATYTTVVAPGGAILKTHPGYSADTLREISASIARTGNIADHPLALDKAPKKLVVGCPIEPMPRPLASQSR